MYDRNHQSVFKKIQVSDAILVSKIFTTVFKVTDIMAMPDDAERIRFIKPYQDFCLTLKYFFHFSRVYSLCRNTDKYFHFAGGQDAISHLHDTRNQGNLQDIGDQVDCHANFRIDRWPV